MVHSNQPDNQVPDSPGASQISCKIYVGNLAWATDENALGSHFASVGVVKEAVVMRSEGRSRGFGFVTFSTPDQAKQAISTMYDSELHGRRLRVNVANQVRAGGTGAGDYQAFNGPPTCNYHYPPAVYPGGGGPSYPGGPYGGYSHQPPLPQGAYMGSGGYMNAGYPANEHASYDGVPPPNHPVADTRKGPYQTGGYYPNGPSYGYTQSGYGQPPY